MIRFILVLTFLALFVITTQPALFVLKLRRKKHPYSSDMITLRMVQWSLRVVLFITKSSVTVIGEENVPKDVPVLYVGNHRSYFDIIITYARCPRPTGYVSKDFLAKVPFLSTWMKRLHCLFLNRDDIKEGLRMILTGVEQINEGISMCIFPEGTRGKTDSEFDMAPFKEGSFKMATKSGCPIVPMAITGSANIWEHQYPRIKPAHVILQYGEPIYPKELSKEEQKHLGRYTQERILHMLKEQHEQATLPQS